MALRLRQNFIGGLIDNTPLGVGDTTLNSAALSAVGVVTAGVDYIPIVLDPEGLGGAPEIVYITDHAASASSATISRAEEGTGAREHRQDIRWVHGPTAYDFDEPIQTYTPTWDATTTTPTLGDGSLDGMYTIKGRKLNLSIHLVGGSTTNWGAGEWTFSLPDGVTAANISGIKQLLPIRAYDDDIKQYFPGNAQVDAGASVIYRFAAGSPATSYFTPTAPFNWAQTDALFITGEILIG